MKEKLITIFNIVLIGLLSLFFSPSGNNIKVLKKEADVKDSLINYERASYLENDLYFYQDNLTIYSVYITFYLDLSIEYDYIVSAEGYFDFDIFIDNYDLVNTGTLTPNIREGISFSSDVYLFSDDLLIPITNLDNNINITLSLLNRPSFNIDGGITLQLLPIIRIGKTTINSQLATFSITQDDTLADIFNNNKILFNSYSNGSLIRRNISNVSVDITNLNNMKEYWESIGFDSGLTEGYDRGSSDGYDRGFADGLSEGVTQNNFMATIRQLLNVVTDTLNIEILPNIKLWYIIGVPLVLAVLKFVIGWFR